MRRLTSLVAMLLGLMIACVHPDGAQADKRVALVIGNSHYKSTAPLPNPVNDAADVASSLSAIGFDVLFKTDLGKHETDLVLAQFARMATGADAALIFYAGHGMQFQGRNYVMPVDAELDDEFSLKYQMTVLDDIRGALEQATGPKIMILDACRNNPLAERFIRSISGKTRDIGNVHGFTRPEPTRGMVIAYSTQADDVAQDGNERNSPFTRALLSRINEPGLEIGTMFRRVAGDVYKSTAGKQLPELSISLLSDFYLNEAQTDAHLWAQVRTTDDADTIRDFLIRFPTSPLAAEAKLRLDLIERSVKDKEARAQLDQERLKSHPLPGERDAALDVPPAAQLPAAGVLVRSIKNELQRVGCYSGAIDEDWNSAATKRAMLGLARYASLSSKDPTPDLLDSLRAKSSRMCPLVCPVGETEKNGQCEAITCARGESLDHNGNCASRPAARPKPKAATKSLADTRSAATISRGTEQSVPASSRGKHCFSFGGKNYCE
jgi:hypothetical protein